MSNTLQERLSQLESPTSGDYIGKLREIIFDDSYQYTDNEYNNIISNKDNLLNVRFAAFYGLFTRYRRFEQRFNLLRHVELYIDLFKDSVELSYFYSIISSQYYKFKCLVYAKAEDFANAIKYANDAIDIYNQKQSQDMGCFNNYADIVLDLAPVVGIDCYNIEMAIHHVDMAISIREVKRGLPPYANYYCSKARLLTLSKDYDRAKEMINLAISYERTDQKDSLIRLSNYQNIKLEIRTKEILEDLDGKIEESNKRYTDIKKQMDNQQSRYIEILSFFSAIIALIIGAVSITLSSNGFLESSALVLVFTGSLIVSYTIFKILFSESIDGFKMFISFLLSAGLIALGILTGSGFF